MKTKKQTKLGVSKLSGIKCSAAKLALVCNAIRGMSLESAFLFLSHSRLRVARVVLECIKSAAANAENNSGLNIAKLHVFNLMVGQDPKIRRYMPRGRGRSSGIVKHRSNLTVILSEV